MTGNDKGMSFHIGETRGGFTALANVFIFSDDPNKSRSSKQLLNALESTLRSAFPLIEENYGRVIRVSANGISAAFERNAEDALAFGISICQRANASEDMAGGFGVSVGITYGKVFTSDVVCGSFSTVIAVSEAVELSNILSRACPRADASILITSALADQIIGFSNRFAKRKIGLILNSSENKTYTIFDVFDGDPAEKKYSKRRSSLLFETGLEYFLEDRPLQARSCFIELLKYDRSDRIAKRYIQLCDKAINGTADDTRDKYLTVI